jgi:PAS domain-containing protein
MLEEIIRQLPLGLICTDLEGEILFMNAAAQELLAFEIPLGEYENHARAQRFPELPVEIRKGTNTSQAGVSVDLLHGFGRFHLQNSISFPGTDG